MYLCGNLGYTSLQSGGITGSRQGTCAGGVQAATDGGSSEQGESSARPHPSAPARG